MAEQYQVEFLPSAQADMVDIVRYISQELSNPIAAENLAQDFVKTADSLSAFPYAHEAFLSFFLNDRNPAVVRTTGILFVLCFMP